MTDASWVERAVFAVILIASLALFWRRAERVLKIIRSARETPDFEVSPVGPRIRKFLWEVMAQGKVIRQRPLPGLAHAFVFWGFCAFALITVNHVATGFGLGFLSPERGFGRFYFDFVAVWAVAVAVGIAGLFVRRFFVRPRWLGDVSPESGVIAFLIFRLDGDVPGGLVVRRRDHRRTCQLVAAHAVPGGLPAADSPYQAPAPGAQPAHRVPRARGLQRASRRSPETRISASTPARTSRASTPCRPIAAWNADAAPSTARRSIRGRCSIPRKSFWACAPT